MPDSSDTRAAVPTLRPGDRVGDHYLLLECLCVGGADEAFEAVNIRTGRRVAITVLGADAPDHPEQERRFKDRARVSSLLGHPNVVNVLDMALCPTTGSLFLVEEFLDGETLAALSDSPDEGFSSMQEFLVALLGCASLRFHGMAVRHARSFSFDPSATSGTTARVVRSARRPLAVEAVEAAAF